MLSLYLSLQISYVSKLQDKHNASSFFNMSWKELPQSDYKSREFLQMIPYFLSIFFTFEVKLKCISDFQPFFILLVLLSDNRVNGLALYIP